MNNLTLRESIRRANSVWRYRTYSKVRGKKLPALPEAMREWCRRFWFEWSKR